MNLKLINNFEVLKKEQPVSLQSILNKLLIALSLLIIAIIILRSAWTCDDAYISFRTIYNLTHGYGLTFNINERVQSFTDRL